MTRTALIVAHGQPSDPEGAEADLARVAAAVGALLPGWVVKAATLAAPGALERALLSLTDPVIVPLFMADGFFTRVLLPGRLGKAGQAGLPTLPPFGLWPETAAIAARAAIAAAGARGWQTGKTTLLLAAHGSGKGPLAAEAARTIAARIARHASFAAMPLGFIEEPPFLADAARGMPAQSLCLPLFVARWGHVRDDVPAALAEAGFPGDVLDPVGLLAEVPGLIAARLGGV